MNQSIKAQIKLSLFTIILAIITIFLGIFIIDKVFTPINLLEGSENIIFKIIQIPEKITSHSKSINIENRSLIEMYTYLILSFLIFGIPLITLAIREILKRKIKHHSNKYLTITKLTFISFLGILFNALICGYGLAIIDPTLHSHFFSFIKFSIRFNSLIVVSYFMFSSWDIIKNKNNLVQYNLLTLSIMTILNLLLFLFIILTPLIFKKTTYLNFKETIAKDPKLSEKIKNNILG